MKRAPNTLPEPGAKNGTFASHRWPAGNTAVPFYYGFDEQLEKTIAFLKSGNYLNVDLFAIRKASDDKMIAPLGSVPFSLAPGDVVQTMVVIQNKNIGHSLIPEVRDLYEAWVEFVATDSTGKEIYHSGFIKAGWRARRAGAQFHQPSRQFERHLRRQSQGRNDPLRCL